MDQITQTPPNVTSTEVGLIVKNELLQQEKRLTQQFRADLTAMSAGVTNQLGEQNKTYMDKLLEHEKRITTNTISLDSLRVRVWVVGASCGTLGGLIGFFVSQLSDK